MKSPENELDEDVLLPQPFKKNLLFVRDNYVNLWQDLLDGKNNPKSPKTELIEVTYMDLESGQEKKKSMSRQELKESGFDWVDDRQDIDSCIVFE